MTSPNTPLISVVIPSYNHAGFIATALESVAVQTYPRIELIVVDDCSKDNTVQAAADWLAYSGKAKRFENVHLLINPENKGADITINTGIEHCTGEYVAILNSDDAFAPSRLAKLHEALQASDTDIAFSRVIPMDDDGKLLSLSKLPSALQNGALTSADRSLVRDPTLGFGFLRENIAISTGNLLIRRTLFDRIGMFRPLKYVHDWDFILRSLIISEPVYVAEDLYLYRIHGSNSFSSLNNVAVIETQIALQNFRAIANNSVILNSKAPVASNWPGLLISATR